MLQYPGRKEGGLNPLLEAWFISSLWTGINLRSQFFSCPWALVLDLAIWMFLTVDKPISQSYCFHINFLKNLSSWPWHQLFIAVAAGAWKHTKNIQKLDILLPNASFPNPLRTPFFVIDHLSSAATHQHVRALQARRQPWIMQYKLNQKQLTKHIKWKIKTNTEQVIFLLTEDSARHKVQNSLPSVAPTGNQTLHIISRSSCVCIKPLQEFTCHRVLFQNTWAVGISIAVASSSYAIAWHMTICDYYWLLHVQFFKRQITIATTWNIPGSLKLKHFTTSTYEIEEWSFLGGPYRFTVFGTLQHLQEFNT